MSTAEKIIIRWLSGLMAGISGVAAVIVSIDDINRNIVIGILIASAFLSGLITTVTTQAGQQALGLRARRG